MAVRLSRPALLAISAVWLSAAAMAAEVQIKVPELSGNRHAFYQQLLEQSLKAAGHSVKLEVVKNVPQPRVWFMVENNELPIFWGLQTKERDGKYIGVNNNLTNSLIGQRVLLIPKGGEAKYAAVSSVDQFRATGVKGAFGPGWFDGKVWAANNLAFREVPGEIAQVYKMVEAKDRGVDYFARGANEIEEEAKGQPGLMIEPKLVLVYERDIHFYLAKNAAHLKPILEDALDKAEKSGLKKKLIDANFGPALANLNLAGRVQIKLKTPAE